MGLSVFSLGASFTASEPVNSSGHVVSGAFAPFIYDTDTQQLWFDVDGPLASVAIHIAGLTGGPPTLLLSDFAVIV